MACRSKSGSGSTSFSEVEDLSCWCIVLRIGLRVECNVVSGNRADSVRGLEEAEATDCCIHKGNVVFDGLIKFIIERRSGLFWNTAVYQVPSDVLSDESKHVQTDSCREESLNSWAFSLFQLLEGAFKHVAIAKGEGKRLNFVWDLVLPHIKEWNSCFHFLLNKLGKRPDLCDFFVVDKVL